MADIEQEAIADLKQTYEKTQLAKNSLITPDPQLQVDEFQDYDDPNEDFMEEVQKRALQNIHDKDETDFVDENGEIDFEAIREHKKKKKNPFAIDKLDHEQIDYSQIRKDFYLEEEEIANMPASRVLEIRQKLEIRTFGENIPNPIESFDQLNLDERFYKEITRMGIEEPTPIQAQALPLALRGRDVIGIAKTGSGKTFAYIWPMLVHVLHQERCDRLQGPIAMIMCPTRELCQQVYVECKRFSRKFDLNISVILGGENKQEQWKELRNGFEILIATPGRLIDVYKKKAFNFLRTSFVVIDEADKMFGLGFEEQMKSVLSQVRPDRQVLLFSATYKKKVRDLSTEYLKSPVQIVIGKESQVNEDIKQEFVIVDRLEEKMEWLIDSMHRMVSHGKVLIFVNHIKSCNDLYRIFKEFLANIDFVILHGDKLQYERSEIIKNFKKHVDVMIATDVASRGLDIPAIRFVINYENPKDGETYVHRIGRTGRAGNKDGVAISCLLKSETKFAAILATKLSELKLAVPPDLRYLAEKDQHYREGKNNKGSRYSNGKRFTGINGTDKASLSLKRALESGQVGKTGLGYQKESSKSKKKKKSKEELENEVINQTYGSNLNEELKQVINVVNAEEFKIKVKELYGHDKNHYTIKKKISRFSEKYDPHNEANNYEDVQITAAEMDRILLDEKKHNMKNELRNKFRSSFKKSGVLVFGGTEETKSKEPCGPENELQNQE